MTKSALDLWGRALDAYGVAEREVSLSPDNSALCAYYAAFHAVGALLIRSGKGFNSHEDVDSLLHKKFVKPGLLKSEIGTKYRILRDSRRIGSYGGENHVTPEEAIKALAAANQIIEAVFYLHPDEFSRPVWLKTD